MEEKMKIRTIFISFLYLYVYVSVNINAVKREILHHRVLNVLNRLFFKVGSVSTKADNCPNEREFIACSFPHYQHPYLCTYFG